MSENLKGKNSPSWKIFRGDKSSRWKGGPEKYNFRDTSHIEYKIWRKAVFERDNYRCLICGEVGVHLNAHHIKNWAGYLKLRYDVNNGMTMCEKCHNLVDKELPLFSIKRRKNNEKISISIFS